MLVSVLVLLFVLFSTLSRSRTFSTGLQGLLRTGRSTGTKELVLAQASFPPASWGMGCISLSVSVKLKWRWNCIADDTAPISSMAIRKLKNREIIAARKLFFSPNRLVVLGLDVSRGFLSALGNQLTECISAALHASCVYKRVVKSISRSCVRVEEAVLGCPS